MDAARVVTVSAMAADAFPSSGAPGRAAAAWDCCSYDDNGVAWLPALSPGDPLWPEIITDAKMRRAKAAEEAAAAEAAARAESAQQAAVLAAAADAARAMVAAASAAAAAAGQAGTAGSSVSSSRPETAAGQAEPQSTAGAEAAASSDSAAGSAPEAATPTASDDRTFVVLYGPPLAGTSTQARSLALRYHVPVTTLDALLEVGLSDEGMGLGGGGGAM
jgi:hypothetical protein